MKAMASGSPFNTAASSVSDWPIAEVAERIREGIEYLGIEHKAGDKGILTVSCGVTAFDTEENLDRWEDLLDRADKALYAAKTSGRNRVCSQGKP